MTKPYVIAINSVSGGGKSTVARLVQESLDAGLFCFDDFDDTNVFPEDFYEWWKRGADLLEFDCPGMRSAVEAASRRNGTAYIVLDYPFGRDHPRFRDMIDLSVFIDTPLDVAMARRILRDYDLASEEDARGRLRTLQDELRHYLERARFPYLDTDRHKETSDLVLDGCLSPERLRDCILESTPVSRLAPREPRGRRDP